MPTLSFTTDITKFHDGTSVSKWIAGQQYKLVYRVLDTDTGVYMDLDGTTQTFPDVDSPEVSANQFTQSNESYIIHGTGEILENSPGSVNLVAFLSDQTYTTTSEISSAISYPTDHGSTNMSYQTLTFNQDITGNLPNASYSKSFTFNGIENYWNGSQWIAIDDQLTATGLTAYVYTMDESGNDAFVTNHLNIKDVSVHTLAESIVVTPGTKKLTLTGLTGVTDPSDIKSLEFGYAISPAALPTVDGIVILEADFADPYEITGLALNTTYDVFVKATDNAPTPNVGDWIKIATETPVDIVKPVEAVTIPVPSESITPTSGIINGTHILEWNWSSESITDDSNDAVKLELYRVNGVTAPGTTNTLTKISEVTDCSIVTTILYDAAADITNGYADGTSYTVFLFARDQSGNETGPIAQKTIIAVDMTPPDSGANLTGTTDVFTPAVSNGTTVTSEATHMIGWNWTAGAEVGGATTYVVYELIPHDAEVPDTSSGLAQVSSSPSTTGNLTVDATDRPSYTTPGSTIRFLVWAKDDQGNELLVQNTSVTVVDTVPPAATVNVPSVSAYVPSFEDHTNSVTPASHNISWTWTSADSSDVKAYAFTGATAGDASTGELLATDSSGTISLDLTTHSGTYTYSIGQQYTVAVYAYDISGNHTGPYRAHTFTGVDVSPPVAVTEAAPHSTYESPTEVKIIARVSDSSIVSYYAAAYETDQGLPTVALADGIGTEAGKTSVTGISGSSGVDTNITISGTLNTSTSWTRTYYVYAYVADSEGNTMVFPSFTADTIDRSGGSFALSNPVVQNGGNVVLTVTHAGNPTTGSTISSVYYYPILQGNPAPTGSEIETNGTLITPFPTSGTTFEATLSPKDQTYTVYVVGKDSNGQYTSIGSQQNIFADNSAPNIITFEHSTTQTEFSVDTFVLSEDGTARILIVPNGASSPSLSDINTHGVEWTSSTPMPLIISSAYDSGNVSLTAGSEYDVYIVTKDTLLHEINKGKTADITMLHEIPTGSDLISGSIASDDITIGQLSGETFTQGEGNDVRLDLNGFTYDSKVSQVKIVIATQGGGTTILTQYFPSGDAIGFVDLGAVPVEYDGQTLEVNLILVSTGGESTVVSTRTFVMDVTAPSITFTSGSQTSTTVNLSYDIVEASTGLWKYDYKVSTSQNQDPTNVNTVVVNAAQSGNNLHPISLVLTKSTEGMTTEGGTYYVTLHAYDGTGRKSTSYDSRTVTTWDNTGPVFVSNPTTLSTDGTSATISYNVSDAVAGLRSLVGKVSGVTKGTKTFTANTYTATASDLVLTGLSPGSNSVTYTLTDRASELSNQYTTNTDNTTDSTVIVTIDSPPSFDSATITDVGNQQIQFDYTVSHPDSLLSQLEIYINDVELINDRVALSGGSASGSVTVTTTDSNCDCYMIVRDSNGLSAQSATTSLSINQPSYVESAVWEYIPSTKHIRCTFQVKNNGVGIKHIGVMINDSLNHQYFHTALADTGVVVANVPGYNAPYTWNNCYLKITDESNDIVESTRESVPVSFTAHSTVTHTGTYSGIYTKADSDNIDPSNWMFAAVSATNTLTFFINGEPKGTLPNVETRNSVDYCYFGGYYYIVFRQRTWTRLMFWRSTDGINWGTYYWFPTETAIDAVFFEYNSNLYVLTCSDPKDRSSTARILDVIGKTQVDTIPTLGWQGQATCWYDGTSLVIFRITEQYNAYNDLWWQDRITVIDPTTWTVTTDSLSYSDRYNVKPVSSANRGVSADARLCLMTQTANRYTESPYNTILIEREAWIRTRSTSLIFFSSSYSNIYAATFTACNSIIYIAVSHGTGAGDWKLTVFAPAYLNVWPNYEGIFYDQSAPVNGIPTIVGDSSNNVLKVAYCSDSDMQIITIPVGY